MRADRPLRMIRVIAEAALKSSSGEFQSCFVARARVTSAEMGHVVKPPAMRDLTPMTLRLVFLCPSTACEVSRLAEPHNL
jgi:hypothetical protein